MFGIVNYGAFVIAAILLNLTPGVDTVYILTKGMAGGRKHGIVSALGISTGCLVHTILVALGLSIILMSSPLAFFVVKAAGALYLVGMGIHTIIKRNAFSFGSEEETAATLRRVYVQGIITNVLNPKVALFFLAFLPQFIDPGSSVGPVPFLLLGLTFVTTGTVWGLILAFGSSFFHGLLSRNKRVATVANVVAGIIYIILGLAIFTTQPQ
jgi:threonine/homoserine/homoserine lactone efflux protein